MHIKQNSSLKPCLPYDRKKIMKNNKSSTSLAHSKNTYVNFSVTKTKPQISCMSFPYILNDQIQQIPQKKNIRISDRVFQNKQNDKYSLYMDKIENQPVPINQYLSYDLSSQINNGLYQIKVLAQEIKQIKKQKIQDLEQKNKFRPMNKIRIKKYQYSKWKTFRQINA